MNDEIHVIKLGGSLLDLPQWLERFQAYRAELPVKTILLVGGGRAADEVRQFDRFFGLDEATGHWLAIRAMQLNAYCVAAVLPRCQFVENFDECEHAWREGDLALVEPLAWLEYEAINDVHIPRRWTFTSDSIAAHLAARVGATKLILLKSNAPETCGDVEWAVREGLVDEEFNQAAAETPAIELVNLREPAMPRCMLRRA